HVAQQLEAARLNRPDGDVRAGVPDRQRVAVGRGARHLADAERAARPGDILDQHRLAERALHGLGQQPRQRVGRPARRIGHHEADGPGGEGFGARRERPSGRRAACELKPRKLKQGTPSHRHPHRYWTRTRTRTHRHYDIDAEVFPPIKKAKKYSSYNLTLLYYVHDEPDATFDAPGPRRPAW